MKGPDIEPRKLNPSVAVRIALFILFIIIFGIGGLGIFDVIPMWQSILGLFVIAVILTYFGAWADRVREREKEQSSNK